MRREEFEHAIRAAGAVLDVNEVIVIGSQAIHGSVSSDLPVEAVRSVEVDVAVPDDPDGTAADTIDGSIGEASMFHSTFGYYAQGVEESTAVLPDGWRDRLVPFETPSTGGVTALCLEVHDLWISKAIAGRPKDVEFCRALVDRGLVDVDVLKRRLAEVPELDLQVREAVERRIAAAEAT
ncbi:MAG TPA: DUF6036 family nucleotidyltransferase [Longimicrobiales bacterium]|nr:DUF6036 family nucleotidyltransferase [Longimicrobiales bacterium]